MYPESPVEYHTTNDKADKNDDLQNQSGDTVWTFLTYTTDTTPPTALPLAPGTLRNCSTYTQYYAPLRNTSTVNTCYVVARLYDGNSNSYPIKDMKDHNY
mgnify:CR=1 FL=1